MLSYIKKWVFDQYTYLKNLIEETQKTEDEKKSHDFLINVIKNKITKDVDDECKYYKNNIDVIIRQFFSNENEKNLYKKFIKNGEVYDLVSFLNLKLSQKTANQYMYFAKATLNDTIFFTVSDEVIDVTSYINAIMIEKEWK